MQNPEESEHKAAHRRFHPMSNAEMQAKNSAIIESIGRSLLFKSIVYGLPVVFIIQLCHQILTAQETLPHLPDITLLLSREGSAVLLLFLFQRYFASYTARRASTRLRRTDAWSISVCTFIFLLLLLPMLLSVSWPLASLVSFLICVFPLAAELHKIKTAEVDFAKPRR